MSKNKFHLLRKLYKERAEKKILVLASSVVQLAIDGRLTKSKFKRSVELMAIAGMTAGQEISLLAFRKH